jgi:carbonic anhydrase
MYALLSFLLLLSLTHTQETGTGAVSTDNLTSSTLNYALGGLDWGGDCATGQSQSPIDILTSETFPISDPYFSAVSLDIPPQLMPLQDFWLPYYFATNGTVMAVLNEVPLEQYLGVMHFNLPSAHTIDGLRYPLELHASFFPADSSDPVKGSSLAILFQEGAHSSFLDSYLNSAIVDYSLLIPSPIEDYFYYSGSREIPDCTEPNLHVIPNQVFEASVDQISAFASGPYAAPFAEAEYHGMYRNTQPLNGRIVYHRVSGVETESFLVVIAS